MPVYVKRLEEVLTQVEARVGVENYIPEQSSGRVSG
jgi:hypothetical protein